MAKQTLFVTLATGLMLGCTCQGLPCFEQDDLIAQAASRARSLNPNAIVFEASGVNRGCACIGGVRAASRTFLAIDTANANDNGTYRLTHDGIGWTTDTHPFPTLGAGYYDLTQVTMTQAEARSLLLAAGHADDFHGWSLHRPLHPSATPAQFTFNYGDKAVMIDTVSGAVSVMTPALAPPLFGAAPGDDCVSRQMIAAADAKIKETAASAFIIWSGGRDGDGNSLSAAADTNVWDFVAVAQDNGDIRAWRLVYNGTWTIELLAQAPFGVVFQDLNANLTMDVVDAWALAVAAGFSPPFAYWEVLLPLNPNVENIIYIFPGAGGFIIVDSVTGEVSLEVRA